MSEQTPAGLAVAVVQNNAGRDFSANMNTLEKLIGEAAANGADLVATPEYCSHYGVVRDETQGRDRLDVGSAPFDGHQAIEAFASIARKIERPILIGSIGVLAPDGRTLNTSVLLGGDGKVLARYEKIHLFDVDLAGGESYRESADIAPGDKAILATLSELSGAPDLGMSICYDVRFPHLYRDLAKAGASILTVPAAFTARTGKAHWHTLLRARAIETGSFIVAPSQCGADEHGRLKRYGHALIVAPWGEVLADAGDNEGVVMAEIDLSKVAEARRMVPALQHDRPYSQPVDVTSVRAAE